MWPLYWWSMEKKSHSGWGPSYTHTCPYVSKCVRKGHTNKKRHTKSHTSEKKSHKTHIKGTQEPYKEAHKQCCTELGDTQAKSHTDIPVLVGLC